MEAICRPNGDRIVDRPAFWYTVGVLMRRLLFQLLLFGSSLVGWTETVPLRVDFARTNGTIRALHGINKGPLAPGGLIDLTAEQKALGTPFTRLHDCYWPNPYVVDIHAVFPRFEADPALPESYDFRLTDEYVAAIRATGAEIIYRLGESIEHTKIKRYVHPPADAAKWAAICVGIVRHYNEGWANGFHHGIRYWEIWNEPENRPAMWSGSDEDYFRLYGIAAKTLKQHDSTLKLGGPAVGASGRFVKGVFQPADFVSHFLDRCRTESWPLDFFSWHCYAAESEELTHRAVAIRRLLDERGFTATESHLNEWNYLPGNTWGPLSRGAPAGVRQEFYNEMTGAAGAAFIATGLLELQDVPLDMANLFHGELGGFGLFNEFGVPQKNYYALKAFQALRDTGKRVVTEGAVPGKVAIGAGLKGGTGGAVVMISYFADARMDFHLELQHMPWLGGTIAEIRRIDEGHDFGLLSTMTSAAPVITLALTVTNPAVTLIQLRPVGGVASTNSPYWTVEDPSEREKLPLYVTIPAAKPEELTPANGLPKRDLYRTWHRSHGDSGGTRFSALDQINRQTVTNLQVAWTYHSRDGSNNIQCNPIVVGGIMYAPTAGKQVVAVNAETGVELWRFKPDGRPAFRGLIHWPGKGGARERIFFCAGKSLYAVDPKSGALIAGFGDHGRVTLPGNWQGDFGAATACPAIFENILVVPGWEKDVWGFDIVTGKQLWTFHTVPQPGELGHDTWDQTETYGANAWAGMALDEARGIAYITTGGPKPNFVGVSHLGQNLFANCVVAIDARTGKYLWHFQEIRHDLWDLDVSAPPNLATITRDGRRIDIVAACTKIGNTLLLDRLTGKPIYPFRLRRAPVSTLKGERTWPYQPDVQLPEPFLNMEFTAADLTERTEEVADWARSQFASATKGFFVPCTEGRANLFFGIDGGAEWTGACIDADTGRLYVTANRVGWIISAFREDDPPDDLRAPKTPGRLVYEKSCLACHGATRLGASTCPPLRGLRLRMNEESVRQQIRTGKNAMPGQPDMSEADLTALVDYLLLRDGSVKPKATPPERPVYSVSGYPKFYDPEGYPANKPPWGTLNCIDLNTGRLVWRVPLGEYPKLAAQGIKNTGTENYGGAIVTAGGLVFCAGTRDNKIRAFDKETGAELWSSLLPWTGSAPPASYEVHGRQYIVIAATGGNKLGTPYGDAYVAFALPSKNAPR